MTPILAVLAGFAALVGATLWIAHVVHRDSTWRPPDGQPSRQSPNPGEHEEGTPR